jgi:hypothetical protein
LYTLIAFRLFLCDFFFDINLVLQATAIMTELGVSLDPALAKPLPVNPTPKHILARHKKLYNAVQLLTLASTFRVDGWEYYSARAVVFSHMQEYDLAWQDCMRCITLVESGLTSTPPPNKYEF